MAEISAPPLGSTRRDRGRPRRLLPAALALVALGVGFGGAMWAAGKFDPRSVPLLWSEPLTLARQLARTDPIVRAHLGDVRGFGLLPRGELHRSGAEGWCRLELVVHGERADGRLELRLEHREGCWFWSWANLRLEDGTLYALAVR